MSNIEKCTSETKLLLVWIKNNEPNCIKFVINDYIVKSISVYINYNKANTYVNMIMSYGILFTLATIQYYIQLEDYETCLELTKAIDICNNNYKCDLPKSLGSRWAMENINLSPLEILNKHFKD